MTVALPILRGQDGFSQRIARVVNNILNGKINSTGTITLTASSATTTLNNSFLSPSSVVLFDPKTANAAAELYGGTMYVLTANRGDKTWTITNANNAQNDRTYQYVVLG